MTGREGTEMTIQRRTYNIILSIRANQKFGVIMRYFFVIHYQLTLFPPENIFRIGL
jgi:hypothetical protein